jgi:protein TonB
VRVNATGARPSLGTEKRELFSEDTQTAVVFPDAAVISLTAAVVPGQLVFLSNKENNREVVCQVIRKRNNRPTSCYVELQFTEPQKDFWGVAFPEPPQQRSESPTSLVEKVDADAVSAEVTEEPAADLVTAPNTEEVNLLRHEVDALREQLKALTETKKKEEEEAARKAAEVVRKAQEEADAAIAALAAKRDAPTKPLIRMNLPAASVAPEPSATSPVKPPAAQTSPSQPLSLSQAKSLATPENPGHSAEREAFEDLLPKPELDFSKAPIPSQLPEDDRYSIYKPLRKKVGLRDAILTVAATLLLAAGIGFAWYTDKLPMARRKPPVPAATAKTAATPKPATPAIAPPKGSAPIATPATPTVLPATVPTDAMATDAGGAPVGAIPSESPKTPTGNEFPTDAPVGTKETVKAPAPAAKKRKATIAAAPVAEVPEPIAADAPVLPAKLIRAAKPVYPPNAMRNFITGDVRITAELRTDGHVGKVTVISGPPALRAAAVEAMKQYEYEPATKGGKPQPSQITTTIKFWFDP